MVFRTKEEGREGGTVSVWQSAARCPRRYPSFFFLFSFFFPLVS